MVIKIIYTPHDLCLLQNIRFETHEPQLWAHPIFLNRYKINFITKNCYGDDSFCSNSVLKATASNLIKAF